MRRRLLLVPAICAALLGAPSVASAAGNQLLDGGASPTSGTTSTLFVLEVAYAGRFPAVRVEAQVAGGSLPMVLLSGSLTDGTWRAAPTTLPVGTWPVLFAATSERGNDPTLGGPTITVLGSAAAAVPVESTESASAPSGQSSPQRAQTHGSAPAGGTTPGEPPASDAAAAEPAAPGTPATSDEAPASSDGVGTVQDDPPSPGAVPKGSFASGPAASPASGSGEAGGSGAASPAEAPPATTPPPTDRRVASGHGEEADQAAPMETAEPPAAQETTNEELAGAARVAGAWFVAILAIVAALWAIAFRRRARPAGELEASLLADETTALLERRALRRGRVHLEEDPIVAALGIGDEARPRPRQTASRDSTRDEDRSGG